MSKVIKASGAVETKKESSDNIAESPIVSIKVEALSSSCGRSSDPPYTISTPEIPARSKAIAVVDSFRAPIIVGDCASHIIAFDTVRQWRISITNELATPMSIMILTTGPAM
jgi:hypothetical protein